MLTTEYKS